MLSAGVLLAMQAKTMRLAAHYHYSHDDGWRDAPLPNHTRGWINLPPAEAE